MELYPLFETAFNSKLPPHEWFGANIVLKFVIK